VSNNDGDSNTGSGGLGSGLGSSLGGNSEMGGGAARAAGLAASDPGNRAYSGYGGGGTIGGAGGGGGYVGTGLDAYGRPVSMNPYGGLDPSRVTSLNNMPAVSVADNNAVNAYTRTLGGVNQAARAWQGGLGQTPDTSALGAFGLDFAGIGNPGPLGGFANSPLATMLMVGAGMANPFAGAALGVGRALLNRNYGGALGTLGAVGGGLAGGGIGAMAGGSLANLIGSIGLDRRPAGPTIGATVGNVAGTLATGAMPAPLGMLAGPVVRSALADTGAQIGNAVANGTPATPTATASLSPAQAARAAATNPSGAGGNAATAALNPALLGGGPQQSVLIASALRAAMGARA